LKPEAPPAWCAESLAGIAHGFFGREGGVSTGIYASLNAGPGSKDAAEAIAENRRRIASTFSADHLVSLHQVHSPLAILVDKPFDGPRPEADALVSKTPGLVISILTADCAPILFFEPSAGIVAGAHAGWKGALHGVIEATIALMQREGAARRLIRAAIGPCIHQASYEVGPEFRDVFLSNDQSFTRFFAAGQNGKLQFDLPGFVALRLNEAGVSQVETIGVDTYAAAEACFSHRRSVHLDHGDYGRNCAAITLNADLP
jgi:YfiH family protein